MTDSQGFLIRVRVVPRSSRAAILGWQEDGSLAVRVTVPPEGGRANKALRELLAEALGLPKRRVSLESGSASRIKTIRILGVEETEARSLLGRGWPRAKDGTQ